MFSKLPLSNLYRLSVCACAGIGIALPPSVNSQESDLELRMAGKLTGRQTIPADESTFITSDKLTGNGGEDLLLEGDVVIQRKENTIRADKLNYSPITDTAVGTGNFELSSPNIVIKGQRGVLQVGSGSGSVTKPTFQVKDSGGKGNASKVIYDGIDTLTLENTQYTVCKVPSLTQIDQADWYVQSGSLEIDQGAEMATARDAKVVFQGVPILASPYLSFPTTDRRKSGFLSPSFGSSSRSGTEFALPYYWNIAPNRDMTLTPNLITRRGLQLGTEARYLGLQNRGKIGFDYLPNDQVSNDDRFALTMQHGFAAGPLSAGYNINRVSDNEYFVDFSRNQTIASQRILLQEGFINYQQPRWQASIRTVTHQTLQLLNDPLTPPYDRLPEIAISALPLDVGPVQISASAEVTEFASKTRLEGRRSVGSVRAELPFVRPAYSVTTALSAKRISYSLDQPFQVGGPLGPSNTIPTFSMDGTLFFDRQTTLFGRNVNQTLEPRIFYLRTPFRDQSNQPNFDTTLTAESFSRIFSENRYAGNDRVGDADQITLGVASRTSDQKSGEEILRVEVGQRIYFTQPKVTLDGETPITGDSDFFASVQAKLSDSIEMKIGQQVESDSFKNQRTNLRFSYAPSEGKQFNFGYRYTRGELDQVDISGQWPISRKWSAVSRLNYSLLEDRSIENLLGLEYNDGCWVARVVTQRFAVAPELTTTSLFIQLELLGLGRVGSDPRALLSRQVRGYTPNTTLNRYD